MSSKRYNKLEALKKIKALVAQGKIAFSGHAEDEMENDNLDRSDVISVLLSTDAKIDEPEPKYDSWRYRVHTNRIYVVVVIQEVGSVFVVTVFRTERK